MYLIEPCVAGDRRIACLAMLRAAVSLLQVLPEHIRPNVTVQVSIRFVFSLLDWLNMKCISNFLCIFR